MSSERKKPENQEEDENNLPYSSNQKKQEDEEVFSAPENVNYVKSFLEKMGLDFVWDLINIPNNAFRLTNFSNTGTQSITAGLTLAVVCLSTTIAAVSFLQLFGGTNQIFTPYFPDLSHFFAKLDQGLTGRTGIMIWMGSSIVSLISSFSSLYIMENYLDEAWGKLTLQKTEQQLSSYWVILTIVALPFVASVLFNKHLELFYYLLSPVAAKFFGSKILHTIVASLSFSFIYKIFSKGTNLGWKASLIGAVWGAIAFEVGKNLFFSVANWQISTQPVAASIVIFMFLLIGWLMFSVFSFIMGAKVAFVYQNRDVFTHLESYYIQEMKAKNIEQKELRPVREIALICLLELTKRFSGAPISELGKPEDIGVDASELSKLAFIGPERAKEVMFHLNQVGLITILHDGAREIGILRFSPEKLTLNEFLARIEMRFGKNLPEPLNYISNKWFWNEYKSAMENYFGKLTLQELHDKQEQLFETQNKFNHKNIA